MNDPRSIARHARVKGPRVFLDYDQQELDDAYDQAVYAPNRDELVARLRQASKLARERLGAPLREAYGPAPIEQLDIYRTRDAGAMCAFPARRLRRQSRYLSCSSRWRSRACGAASPASRRATRGLSPLHSACCTASGSRARSPR